MPPLTLELKDDLQVVVTRDFAAPVALVWRAHTEPALLKRWCTGPDGWDMPLCQINPVPGGSIRYEWSNGEGGFHLTGEVIEVEAPHRMVHVERMHLPDPTPDNRVETRFKAIPGGTRMVMTMTLPSSDVRTAMIATGMADGMEASYRRLEEGILVGA